MPLTAMLSNSIVSAFLVIYFAVFHCFCWLFLLKVTCLPRFFETFWKFRCSLLVKEVLSDIIAVVKDIRKEEFRLATIKDIANRLGVSVSTVSKGLNGASDISEELRQIVLDTAVEMGYSTKRSKRVENRKLAIFIENMDFETSTQFGYELVLGFKQNAFRHKWDVTVIPVTPAFQLEEKYDTYMLKNGFCGAFLIGFALHDEWMKQLETTTMPTVLFDNYIRKNPNVAYIGTDNYEGIDAAVDHLYTLGHKRSPF